MKLFDSHAHYDDEKFDEDRDDVIQSIYNSGVDKFISAGYSLESSKDAIKLANKYEFIYTTVGISPNDVKTTMQETIEDIAELGRIINREDYYWNKENKEIQKQAFIKQIELANKLNLTITIHTREAVADTLEILKQHPVNKKGVFHCCPLNRELVKEALKLGFYISFAGPVTFKNSKNAQEIVEMVPNNRMLIETDSPYLAPEPVRGTRNDSRNVKYIAEKIASIKQLQIEEVAEITYQNTLRIFNI